MKLYLVRHGESEGNAAKRFLAEGDGLTKKGAGQAEKLAKRFRKIPVDVVISSDYKRAVQTAKIIIRGGGKKKHVITALIREGKYPKEYRGRHESDPEIARIRVLKRRHVNNRNWHYSDEENFFDLKARIEKFLRFLSKRSEKRVLVVGHGLSMRMAVGLMLFGESLTPRIFDALRYGLLTINTGITVCEMHDGKWEVLTWNDHAHLG